jgi:predicted heme/steroid binding protein
MCASSSPPDKARSRAGEDSSARACPERAFTADELAGYDGTVPGRPVLIAYRGRVYDVGDRFMWITGQHFWLRAGRDLTGQIDEAPHGEEMLKDVPCVGIVVGTRNKLHPGAKFSRSG